MGTLLISENILVFNLNEDIRCLWYKIFKFQFYHDNQQTNRAQIATHHVSL